MSEPYFHSTKLGVIGLITAGVVAVGALGGLAGVAFDPDPTPTGLVVQPGGSPGEAALEPAEDPAAEPSELPTQGSSEGPAGGVIEPPTGDGALQENGGQGLGALDPQPVEPSEASPSEPAEPAEPFEPAGGGEGVTLGNGVQVYLPPGWQVVNQSDASLALGNGEGSWAYALTGTVEPATDAGTVIAGNLDATLPQENYTQLAFSDVAPLEPFGALVSAAYVDYESLWVDAQGSILLHGQIYAAVRQDGTALIVLVEHAPVDDWASGFEELAPLVAETFDRFGGAL